MPESPTPEEEFEPPTGLPEEAREEDVPLGVPPDEEEAERELPGFPEGDIDTAG
jgi:hypothetical protein